MRSFQPNFASSLFNLTFNHDTGSFSIDDHGFVGGTDYENHNWPDTNNNGREAVMKPETLAMIKQYQNLFQPIIDRGGYVADKIADGNVPMYDPVNFIIPGLIRVAEGDIEGVPAGDYPLENFKSMVMVGDSATNRYSVLSNVLTLSLSENIKSMEGVALGNMYQIQSLLLPSTLKSGNIGRNFCALGNTDYLGLDTPTDRATWPSDGPRATGLGTQPTDKPVDEGTITGVTTSSILYELYYPLTMPYYLKS